MDYIIHKQLDMTEQLSLYIGQKLCILPLQSLNLGGRCAWAHFTDE